MANYLRKRARRNEIQALREEGEAAYKAGKHIQTMPAKYNHSMDAVHWRGGYIEARDLDAAEDLFMDKLYNECTDPNL